MQAPHHSCEFEPRSWWGVLDTSLWDKVRQLLATGRRFSTGTSVTFTNKAYHHDIAEIQLPYDQDHNEPGCYRQWLFLIVTFNMCHLHIYLFGNKSWNPIEWDKVRQLLATGRRFSTGTSVSFTNKAYHHDITEILLKVAINTISQKL
jgi:hypothetical protein